MKVRAAALVTVLAAALAAPVTGAPAAGAPDAGPTFSTTGPSGGSVPAFAFGADGRMFAGSKGAGVFSSDDGGRTWVRRDTGLPTDVSVSHVEAWPTSRVVYLSSYADGAYRSTDNGTTWQRISEIATVNDIAFHPSAPDRVFLASSGLGLRRSTNGGATWTELTEPTGQPVHATGVEIAPSSATTVFLMDHSLRRSTDAGATWTGIGPGYIIAEDFEVDPRDPRTIYVSDLNEGIQRTTDGGAHWTALGVPEYGMDELAVDPTDSSVVWAGYWGDGTVYRSGDSGDTWSLVTIPGAPHATPVVRVGPDGRAWVGAEHRGDFVSADDGASWKLRRSGFVGSGIPALVAPTSDLVIAGTLGDGVQRSTDGGVTWSSGSLRGAQVRSLVSPRGRPDEIVAGTNLGIFRSGDGGLTWARVARFPVNDVTFAPSSPSRGYAAYSGGWAGTTDGGRTWQRHAFPLGIYGAGEIVVHPTRPARIWASCTCGVMWSTDGGATWRTPQTGPTPGRFVNELIAPVDRPGTLYAASDEGLFRSTGSGRDGTWEWLGPEEAGNVDGMAITTAPSDSDTLYYGAISDSGYPGVYRSVDGGETWTRWTSGMVTTWVQSLAVTPDGSRLLTGTTGYGVDGGGGVLLADLP